MSDIHTHTRKSYLGHAFAVFGAAVAAAAALEGRQQPKARDLRTLGIDPDSFSNIRQR